jgi:hypothetical protein
VRPVAWSGRQARTGRADALTCATADGREQVRADAEQFGDSLEGPSGFEYHPAGLLVGEPLGQVMEEESRAFNADQVDDLEAAGD